MADIQSSQDSTSDAARLRMEPATLYQENLSTIPVPIADVFEEYSGIPREQQKDHVLALRNSAYRAHPYPCLGRFRFLELDLSSHPLYRDYVLPKLKDSSNNEPPIFLDLGTCLGQDIRKLIFDGGSPARIYGSDIVPDFIDAGYELFRDEHKFPRDRFICPANVFDTSPNNNLSVLDGKVDILHATAVFHLFSGEQQPLVAERCLRLLRKEPGTRVLVLGAQVGNVVAQDSERPSGRKTFRHNEESWRKLWEDVVGREEFRDVVKGVEVKAEMKQRTMGEINDGQQQKMIGRPEEGFRWMVYQVWVQF